MSAFNVPSTGADALVRRMREHGVRHVFGYPGGQLTPLYDALYRDGSIRHILARDEQAAGFMADGYARASGKPGICLAVCGPGVMNATTPLGTAFTDSVPLLLISGQVPLAGRGLRSGYYHENDQLRVCGTLTKEQHLVEQVDAVVAEFDRAYLATRERRPGPVFLEFPLDIQRASYVPEDWPGVPRAEEPAEPWTQEIDGLMELLTNWKKPLLMVGGGVISAGASRLVVELAERLGAPVFITAMGKSAFPSDHPLAAGLPWHRATSDLTNMESMFSPLLKSADGLLAIGCRFSQLATGSWAMPMPPETVQIDVDRDEIGRHYPVNLGVWADARKTLELLLAGWPGERRAPWTEIPKPKDPWRLPGLDLVGPLRRNLPRNAIAVADITRLGYMLLTDFDVYEPRTLLHPAGYVSMGYGIPAALGAKTAFPERKVATVVGDGCFLMSGMELATAVQEKLPIVVILINDDSLTLIKAIQQRKYESRFLGVDLVNPDFRKFAEAFGVRHWSVESDAAFEGALEDALDSEKPALVEVRVKGKA